MSWNYRVIEFVDPSDEKPWRSIHTVHYDEQGKPGLYSEEPAAVCGESSEELLWTLDRMREALGRPVLVERDFHTPSGGADGDSATQG